jgi:modification methylase
MIKMWDGLFCDLNLLIKDKLENKNGKNTYYLIHKELDSVREEVIRIIKQGRFVCINIGDAN